MCVSINPWDSYHLEYIFEEKDLCIKCTTLKKVQKTWQKAEGDDLHIMISGADAKKACSVRCNRRILKDIVICVSVNEHVFSNVQDNLSNPFLLVTSRFASFLRLTDVLPIIMLLTLQHATNIEEDSSTNDGCIDFEYG